MIAALWSNSNWDDDKGTRKDAIEKIKTDCQEAVEKIRNAGTKFAEPEEEIDHDDPFFAAVDRGLAKLEVEYGEEVRANMKAHGGEINYMKGTDQEPD